MARKGTCKTRGLGQRMPKEDRRSQRHRQRQDIVQWAAEVNKQHQATNEQLQGQLQEHLEDARVPPVSDEQGPTYLPDGRKGENSIFK